MCVKYPRTLIKHLAEKHNYSIEEVNNGIYYVNKSDEMLPIQIIVTSRLNSDENLWLRSLTNQLKDENDAKKLFNEFETNIENKLYESVMDIIIRANTINVLKEDSNMSEVIKTWIGSLREDAINEGLSQGLNQGIEAFIVDALEDGKSEDIIISKLMKRFHFSEAEAKEYFDKYALVSE